MNGVYGRDLDLNLLRVFVVVAETGSVTAAASRLYLTQPAVSAALRRLTTAVGAPLFARVGRGLGLTTRGERLLAVARPHLEALLHGAFAEAAFDPRQSERTVRLGLSDTNEMWLLPPLLRVLAADAPRMRLLAVPVQFRTVSEAFATRRIDLAVALADDLPAGVVRETLFRGKLVCLFDPRHARLGPRPTRDAYLAADHIIVSYNGDFRGVIEDALGHERRVRLSVSTFDSVGRLVDGTALVATVPDHVARLSITERPHLRIAPLPFASQGGATELLSLSTLADDPAIAFLTGHVRTIAASFVQGRTSRPRKRS